ncbi:MAG: PcfJ domain-containing protein [Alistipes sp.]|nr:PcfJ domain-containing protein [Alistipes sp.]
MEKKKLLKLKVPLLSAGMKKAARNEEPEEKRRYGGKTYRIYKVQRYLAAAVEEEILKVGLYTRESVVSGENMPQYIVYLSRKEKEFATYDVHEKKWRTAKIDNLHMDRGECCRSFYSGMNMQTDRDRRLVNEYFKTGSNREIMAAVLDFQSDIRKENLIRKHRNEQEQIDEVMNEVPELPKDFDRWIVNKGFKKHEYLFYKRERPYRIAECLCTHCGKWTYAPVKPEHNKKTKCPVCKTEVTFKSWNRQQTVQDGEWVGILQRLTDRTGYILRGFTCKVTRRFENGWDNYELTKCEDIRVRLDHNFITREFFEYGEWGYTGVIRWCHICRKSPYGGYYGERNFGHAVMYTANLKRELKGSGIAYCNVAKYFAKDKGERTEPAYILATLGSYPMMEYLEKSGFHKIAEEIMGGKMRSGVIDRDAVSLKDALKIDKQRMERLKRLSGGWKMLKALQYEQSSGNRFSDEQLSYIEREHIDVFELEYARTQMNIPRMINYLRRQGEINKMSFHTVKRYYRDYLDMAAERGMDITDEIVCHNGRMMEFHNCYLEEKNRQENEKRDGEVDRKFIRIHKEYKVNQEHFGYGDEEYVVMAPKRASDITREGRLQHHCVGASDRYMEAMERHESYILFLRRKNMEDMPYYTLEAEWNGEIIQAYAAYDRKPDWDTVSRLLDKWSEEIGKRLKKENNAVAPAQTDAAAMAAG